MAALDQELLSVPGIAGAEIDNDHAIAGVRVRLAAGADAVEVGAAVRRILSEHGMRPAAGDGDREHGGPPPPPGAPGAVVDFPLVGSYAEEVVAGVAARVRRPHRIRVEETAAEMRIEVTSQAGAKATRTIARDAGMDGAVAGAVADLADRSDVTLVGVSEESLGGHVVITVLLEVEGTQRSGSAVQRGGRPFALAEAVWAALSG